jgi:hypothetical protein
MQLWVREAPLPSYPGTASAGGARDHSRRAEADGSVTDPTREYLQTHSCRSTRSMSRPDRFPDYPRIYAGQQAQMEAEPAVYHTVNGPNGSVMAPCVTGHDRPPATRRDTHPSWWPAEFDEGDTTTLATTFPRYVPGWLRR